MSATQTDEELFLEFDAFVAALPRRAATPPSNSVRAAPDESADPIRAVTPVLRYKLVQAQAVVCTYYTECDRRYAKRCESAIASFKDALKRLYAEASAIRKKYIQLLSLKIKSVKSVLSRTYKDIVPEATGLVSLAASDGFVAPQFAGDIFEHEALLVSLHSYSHVVCVLSRLFGATQQHSDATLVFKKRLRKIAMLKRFVITSTGLNETAFMQFISYLLAETYNWYLHLQQQRQMLALKLDPIFLFKFLFRQSQTRDGFLFRETKPLAFPLLRDNLNETVCGFEIIGDEYEEAQLEFLDYN